jgi:hypothetical protein
MNKTIKYFKTQKNKLINNYINNNKTLINLEKKQSILQDKREDCKRKKCYKFYRDKIKEDKKFEKEQEKKCPKTMSNNKFYECSKLFYNNNPELKTKYNKFVKCADIKCKNITKKMKQISNKIELYIKKQ